MATAFVHHEEHLLLDPAIRDWVVFPMIALVILVGIGRHYAQDLMKSNLTETPVEDLKNKQIALRAMKLRTSGGFLSEDAYLRRKMYLLRKKTGALLATVPGPPNPMSNPDGMMNMMKGNLVFMLPNIVMMGFVSYFFSGFVCVKVPFPLPSNRFKVMLQRGVDLKSLDVSYVSSLALYFIAQFGLSGVYQLILGTNVMSEDERMMQMQMGMAGVGDGNPAGFDAKSAFTFEKDQLTASKYTDMLSKNERTLLGAMYPSEPVEGLGDLSRFDNLK